MENTVAGKRKKSAKQGGYRVGFDLGGTKMMAVVFGRDFGIIARKKERTRASRGGKKLFEDICATIEGALRKAGIESGDLEGIGMGAPGPVDPASGRIVFAPNLPLDDFPMAEALAKSFKVTAAVDNDVNMGVYAEFHFGATVGRRNVLGVFPGTGIGAGLIIEGRLHHGASGAAGEVGHTLIDPAGPLCGCGRRGCLEALCARPAIASRAAVLALRGEAPHLLEDAGTDVANIRSGALARAIKAGDRSLESLLRDTARRMGRSLSGILNVLSPDTLLLGGGLVEKMPGLFVKAVGKGVAESVVPIIAEHIEIRVAELGDDAVAMGAAKLVDERQGS